MENKILFEKLKRYKQKLDNIYKLKNIEKLEISLDRLKAEKNVEQELLYFTNSKKEEKGIFVFSYNYFLKELKDQELKKQLGRNMLNLLIKDAYKKARNDYNKAKVNDIINEIIFNNKNVEYLSKTKILKRILLLSYYHNIECQKDNNQIDSDYIITIPDDFCKIKQRFNLDITIPIIDNEEFMIFINAKCDLCVVLKYKEKFGINEINKIFEMLKKEFNIKKIEITK